MADTTISYEPIGVIRTDYSSGDDLPKQAANSEGTARVELHEEYADGVTDLDSFSHLILLYHLHASLRRKVVAVSTLFPADLR